MSMWYDARLVSLILKLIVWPWLTLMSVAKPWIVASPEPETPQTLWGVPGNRFSVTIALPDNRVRSSTSSTDKRHARRALVAGAQRRRRHLDLVISVPSPG